MNPYEKICYDIFVFGHFCSVMSPSVWDDPLMFTLKFLLIHEPNMADRFSSNTSVVLRHTQIWLTKFNKV